MIQVDEYSGYVSEALERLQVDNLVFAMHDGSFPSDPEDDTGRGTPYSPAGRRLLGFVCRLGFNGVQLGPQGATPEGEWSPYEGAAFSRSPLSISLAELADPRGPWEALLAPAFLSEIVEGRPAGPEDRVPHARVQRAHHEALRQAHRALLECDSRHARTLRGRLERFRRKNAQWLEPDALFEALLLEHPGSSWKRWLEPDRRLWIPPAGAAAACAARRRELRAKHEDVIARYVFAQLVAHEQHHAFQQWMREIGLRLYGDLQIGISQRDEWSRQTLFLPGYAMGAPPSRTNPEGQAWQKPVFDPRSYRSSGRPGPVIEFLSARMDKMFAEYDSVRVDHPHGLVCPWVYRSDGAEPQVAVRHGARLLASPDLPDHPGLARFAIAGREQLNPDPRTPRFADDWVMELSEEQVDAYGVLFEALVASARRRGRDATALVCEVLSTLPYPLARVLERHGLGRFRVTQKADPSRSADVYRSENARPADWIMIGSHDTPPIWRLLDEWRSGRRLEERARYLAKRLAPQPVERARLVERMVREPAFLAQAQFADLFAGPARNVVVFFSDLFGIRETYNRPGTVSEENWSLRLSRHYRSEYLERVSVDRAANLPLALALALRARGDTARSSVLVSRLESLAEALRRGEVGLE
jgi:4-alpha-glucanotransferase